LHTGELPQASKHWLHCVRNGATAFAQDPAYNANLALTGKGFTLGENAPINWAQLLG
jgi:hypothetical protein